MIEAILKAKKKKKKKKIRKILRFSDTFFFKKNNTKTNVFCQVFNFSYVFLVEFILGNFSLLTDRLDMVLTVLTGL